jgi:hypothetical protein
METNQCRICGRWWSSQASARLFLYIATICPTCIEGSPKLPMPKLIGPSWHGNTPESLEKRHLMD